MVDISKRISKKIKLDIHYKFNDCFDFQFTLDDKVTQQVVLQFGELTENRLKNELKVTK